MHVAFVVTQDIRKCLEELWNIVEVTTLSLSLKTILSLLLVLSARGLQNGFGILLRRLSSLLAVVMFSGDRGFVFHSSSFFQTIVLV